MPEDFLIRAALAAIGLAVAAGPLGAFVLWRRMAYVGDATAHAAILGVALALALSLPVVVGTAAVALAVGITVATLTSDQNPVDATLGVVAHSALAVGLVALSLLRGVRVNVEAMLFGDILTVTSVEIWQTWAGAATVLVLLVWRWSALLTATLNPELAASAGVNPKREQLVLTIALALLVALALKVVGALLAAAMLVIPAAAARGFSRTPEAMAAGAVAIGALASLGGLWLSLKADTPAGPSIVVAAALAFAISRLFGHWRG